MGGCCTSPKEISPPADSHLQDEDLNDETIGDWICPEFLFDELVTATNNFNSEIVSKNQESSDVVYKGELENLGFIAVKKLKTTSWTSQIQFASEAQRIWEMKQKRISTFLGFCCEENERFLVAEFNDTLAKHLFNEKSGTIEWEMRLRVAYCIAEAVEYLSNAKASYKNLSAYSILFDKNDDACLSCFGLVKEIEDDRGTAARSLNSGSLIYQFGIVLVNLLTGKQILPSNAREMINTENDIDLMDPNLEGRFCDEEALVVFKLALRCLKYEDRESLNIKDVVETLQTLQTQTEQEEGTSSSQQQQHEALQTKTEIPSAEMKEEASSQLSPLGEACLKRDLNAIYEILVKAEYEDDKDVSVCSFKEMLPGTTCDVEAERKLANDAFERKDFESAIQFYDKVTNAINVALPSVYARRCLSSIFCNEPKA
ncbi:hypothetical protein AALP_AA3G330900, partial [Arabis alpina]